MKVFSLKPIQFYFVLLIPILFEITNIYKTNSSLFDAQEIILILVYAFVVSALQYFIFLSIRPALYRTSVLTLAFFLAFNFYTTQLVFVPEFANISLLLKFLAYALAILVSFLLVEFLNEVSKKRSSVLTAVLSIFFLGLIGYLANNIFSKYADWEVTYTSGKKNIKKSFRVNWNGNVASINFGFIPKDVTHIRVDLPEYSSIRVVIGQTDQAGVELEPGKDMDVEGFQRIKSNGEIDPFFYLKGKKLHQLTLRLEKTDPIVKYHVNFSRKPNVYVVFADSLLPQSQASVLLDVSYQGLTISSRFGQFKNVFSDGFPTWNSLNSSLALTHETFDKLGGYVYPEFEKDSYGLEYGNVTLKKSAQLRLFNGFTPSPLFDIFKSNGYKIISGSSVPNLGIRGGLNVDKFITKSTTFCDILDSYAKLSLWNYCGVKDLFREDPIRALISRNLQESQNEEKVFSYIHFYAPGHADARNFSYKDPVQRLRFSEKYSTSLLKADENISYFLDELNKRDEEYILLLFGDHAPWLSANTVFSESNKDFFVRGRFAVFGGCMSNKNICESLLDRISAKFNKRAITPSTIISELISLLDPKFNLNVIPSVPMYTGTRLYLFDEFTYE